MSTNAKWCIFNGRLDSPKKIQKIQKIQIQKRVGLGLGCLMTPGLSKDIPHHVWPYLFKLVNHKIRHQVTHKVGCQPGDCIWSLKSYSGVCVGMYELTYSLYHQWGWSKKGPNQFTTSHFSLVYHINTVHSFLCLAEHDLRQLVCYNSLCNDP